MEEIHASDYVYELTVLFTDRYITYSLTNVDVREDSNNGIKLFGCLEHNAPTWTVYVCNSLNNHLKEQRRVLERMLYLLVQADAEQNKLDEHATQLHFVDVAIRLLESMEGK